MTEVPDIGNYRRDPYGKTWDVRVDDDTYIQCKSQFRAEILGRIVKIELAIQRIEEALDTKKDDVDPNLNIDQAKKKIKSMGDIGKFPKS